MPTNPERHISTATTHTKDGDPVTSAKPGSQIVLTGPSLDDRWLLVIPAATAISELEGYLTLRIATTFGQARSHPWARAKVDDQVDNYLEQLEEQLVLCQGPPPG